MEKLHVLVGTALYYLITLRISAALWHYLTVATTR